MTPMPNETFLQNRWVRMTGPLPENKMMLKRAMICEGLSKVMEAKIEFLSPDRAIRIEDIIGEPIQIRFEQESGEARSFEGLCVSVEYVGDYHGANLFVAEVRSWLWFLNRTHENRIFQQKSTLEIIMEILGDYGFTSQVEHNLTATYEQREYCVQYDETDFDFISRLMAEEGIYFINESDGSLGNLKLVDDTGSHIAMPGNANLAFHTRDDNYRPSQEHIFEWNEVLQVTSGQVSLNDYDFETPAGESRAVSKIKKGKGRYADYELYHYPTRSRVPAEAQRFARVRMEVEAVRHKLMRGMGNARNMTVGARFTLTNHPRVASNQEYLVIGVVHHFEAETDDPADEGNIALSLNNSRIARNNDFNDSYRCEFEAIPAREQFRAPFVVPWPKISGVQTAVVTGPNGEEIHTDQHGRVKVQFFWDRLGMKDDKTSCFVRCSMPWTGKNWGMIAIPRIGQEVVVQFEDGNPDRPIVTGMLYNADTLPPYTLPANATQTGMKTQSSKSGSAETYNELVFEDKKNEEFVRLQSEKDFTQIIKNNATITIGAEKQDNGDLTQTIFGHKIETLDTGDHTFTVSEGNQTIAIKKDHDETIEGTSTQTITGDTMQIIKTGNVTQSIKTGNLTQTVAKGNATYEASMGDYKITAGAGKIDIEAALSITLKVGANEVKIDPSGVSIKGTTFKAEGTAMATMKGPKALVDGSAMLELKGGLVKIN